MIDYLCIGHLTEDVTADGITIGGTAAFSILTAKALKVSCGLVTSYKETHLPEQFDSIEAEVQTTETMLRFENHYEKGNRIQFVPQQASPLRLSGLPENFYNASITHIGPVLNDVVIEDVPIFQNTFLCLTPQGWLRENVKGKIKRTSWEKLEPILPLANAVILSQEDIEYNKEAVDRMKHLCALLVVTEGYNGANLFWQGKEYHFHAPAKQEIDPTGAGDIFSTVFFILYHQGYSPHTAGKIATDIASISVTRKGLNAVPKAEEIIRAIYQHSISETE
jgi:hypothetical protein